MKKLGRPEDVAFTGVWQLNRALFGYFVNREQPLMLALGFYAVGTDFVRNTPQAKFFLKNAKMARFLANSLLKA